VDLRAQTTVGGTGWASAPVGSASGSADRPSERLPLRTSERVYLTIEYAVLFVLLPIAFAFRSIHIPIIVLLWSAAAVCYWMLLRDRTFERSKLWSGFAGKQLAGVLGLWGFGVLVVGGLTKVFAPELFLSLPRENLGLWLAIVVGYPGLSVVPQNIVYRGFIFHRYRDLFPSSTGMILASAFAFCFAHVVFQNFVALAATAVGGLIFAHTYERTRSIKLVSIEHALYGAMLFTLGLGKYLYAGA
jgi:uncharacterized protein